MRVAKQFEPGIGGRRSAGVLVHHRWRRWADRIAARAVRQSDRPALDVVYARVRTPWTVERFHTLSEVERLRPSIQLHFALAFASRWLQTSVVAPDPRASRSPDREP